MIPKTESLPVFDEANALALLENDRELLLDVLDLFRSTSVDLIEELRRALESLDPKQVGQAAHALKGASGNVSAQRVAKLTGALEEQSHQAWSDDFPELVDLIVVAVDEFNRQTESVT